MIIILGLTIGSLFFAGKLIFGYAREHRESFKQILFVSFLAGAIPGFLLHNITVGMEWGLTAWYVLLILVMVFVLCLGAVALWGSVHRFFAGISGPRNNVYINHFEQHQHLDGKS